MTALADLMGTLLPQVDEITERLLADTLAELPDHAHDEELVPLLRNSIAENLRNGMVALADGHDLSDARAAQAALLYARRMAQRNIGLSVLLRAYRLGQATFFRYAGDQVTRSDVPDSTGLMIEMVDRLGTFVDRVSEHVASAYEQERELWVGSRAGLRQQTVARILAGEVSDRQMAEQELGYPLSGWHLALSVRADPTMAAHDIMGALTRLRAVVGAALPRSSGQLVVPTDAFGSRLWIHGHRADDLEQAAVKEALAQSDLLVHVAVGPARHGSEGFRSSSAMADQVQALADGVGAHGQRSVLTHREVAVLTLIADDRAEVHEFLTTVLGPLAEDSERCGRLRETLQTFLECGRSYHRAAERLIVHRNTVHYRVQQALLLLGRELGDDTLELQLALRIARWHGVNPRQMLN